MSRPLAYLVVNNYEELDEELYARCLRSYKVAIWMPPHVLGEEDVFLANPFNFVFDSEPRFIASKVPFLEVECFACHLLAGGG